VEEEEDHDDDDNDTKVLARFQMASRQFNKKHAVISLMNCIFHPKHSGLVDCPQRDRQGESQSWVASKKYN